MRIVSILLGLACLLPVLPAAAQEQTPHEIVVRGRQPGPPLWRVTKGENELWIFPMLSPIPKGMEWDARKVAEVIATADEVLLQPDLEADISRLTLLNPLNVVRGMSLARRLTRNPDKAGLAEVLPPELYTRFAALKTAHFPRNKDIEKLRPLAAGGRMTQTIQEGAGLTGPDAIGKELRRLYRRNKRLVQTPVEVRMDLRGSFKELSTRLETFVESLPWEQELACFEAQLWRMERDLDAMRYRADSWARGYIDEFLGIPLRGSSDDPCLALVMAGSEQAELERLRRELDAQWLVQAERALQQNRSTFAVLNITELLSDDGLLDELAARGYVIHAP